MNELYQEYIKQGGDLSLEDFNKLTDVLPEGGLESFVDTLKKKVNPTENGTPSLTTGTPPSQTDLPILKNPIPENEFNVPLGSEQDLSSPSLGITAEMLSTDLPSTATVSSGTENSNITLPTVTQPALSNVGDTVLSTIQKPKTPLDVLAGKSNDTQVDTAILSNPTEINADASENNFEANQVKIDAQKSSNDFIDQYKNKDYVDAEKKFAVQPFDTYGLSDNNQQDIVALEKSGVVEIQRDESGNPILEGNQYRYKYVDKNYYDNTYIPYIDKLQREYKSQAQEQNIDSARFNFGNAGNEPEQDGFGEFVGKASKFGVLPTTEEYENLTTTEQRNEYLATAEATQNAQKNGTTFQEEYDKVIPKYALTEQVKIANGFEALNLLNGGLESGSTKDKSESDFFNNYFADKNNVLQFGEYWSNEGKAKYQSSQVMENQANYQAHRAEIWNDYLSYQNDKLGTDARFIEEAITNASALADRYALSGDIVSAQKEIDKVNNLSAQYNANEEGRTKISNLYSESNKNFTQLQKQKKQESDLQIKVENGDVLSNVGNILGQIPLGIATSVTSTITGAGRILSSVIPSDNLKDALDIMSNTDLKVGNVKVASLSNKIVDFIGSDGSKYREINGRTYGIKSDGKLFATQYNRGQNDKVEKESVDYNWGSGLAFVSSKMMTDIVLTSAVGGGINKGLASASSRIANSKNIATVFGEGSQLAKSAESFARLAKNADNVSVSGWYVQMYNDSYQMAERGGIKGELNKSLYAMTQSFMQSVIQRINPDINFLKSMNDESRQIVRALMTNEKDKAVQLISAFVKKTGNNVLKETGEELVQQVTQDINNIVINKIGKTNLETTDGQGYKEVVFGTVIPSAVASLMGGKGSRIANINNKEIDLTTYSRNELVTELARDKNGVDLIKDFRNTAYFQSQKDFAQDIANEITERQKYISKVPEVDKYSTPALSEVAPILQKIDKKKEDLKKDDGTFAERINKDIAELTTQANAILDNDLNTNNESPNAETAQSTPQSETVQEQTTETEQPEVATESEQPTIAGEQNVPAELNTTTNGQSAFQITRRSNQAEENVQPSNQAGQDTTNQLPEMGQGIAQSENATQTDTPQEKVNQNVGVEEGSGGVRTDKDFANENESYRVIVGDEAFNDIVNSGVVRTNSDNKGTNKVDGVIDLGGRPTAFPSFSKGSASMSYAKDNPNHYIVVTEDPSIQPSKSGRHGKGSTMFPTDANGKHLKELNGSKVKVYKHVGEGKYELVYANGKAVEQSQEEINEDDIVLADDTLDLINSLTDEDGVGAENKPTISKEQDKTDETAPSDNIGTDGSIEPAISSVQQGGKENNPAPAIEPTTSQGTVEVSNQLPNTVANPKTLNNNQTQLSDNIVATSEKIELPDGSEGYVVKIADNEGNPIQDKNEDSEYDFASKVEADKFIAQKKRGFELSNNKKTVVKKESNNSVESNVGKKVNFTFLGEDLNGEIQLDNKGKEIIVSPDGKRYSSGLAKNVTDAQGQQINFQSTDKTFTPIPQSTYDKLVKRLLGVFKKFGGNVVTDLSEFKAKAKALGFSEIELQNIEYRMDHTAPVGSDGFAVPISDLSGLYPDDVYSNKASLYYGDGLDFDSESASILQSLRDKPNKLVTVYRAVPDLNKDLNKDLKKLNDVLYELENDRIPNRNEIVRKFEKEEFYTDKKYFGAEGHKLKARELSDIIREEIRILNESKSNPIKINSGDWVTINKKYAILHGQSNLDGKYKIVQKKLKASQVFTDANSLHEQGVEFMKTANGEIYGAKLPDGTIYLNPDKVNANTPIHEFSHLWQQLMPTRFKKGVELLKNTPIGKNTFAELKANEGYANKSDEELWNEAMVTVMGNEGERIFNSPRTSKLKEWLTDLFKALGSAFGIRDLSPNDKLSTFVKGALSEVMGTKEIIPESSVEQKEVPIYIKKMSNTDLRGMLDKLGLVMDAVCP